MAFTQNHDQIANALQGVRSSVHLSLEQQKLSAAILILSPFIPLIFMGQEYGEAAGFHYFTDHTDPALAKAVREGRKKETGGFLTEGGFKDPQDARTFRGSKLDWRLPERAPHSDVLAWYRDLIDLRRQHPAFNNCRKDLVRVEYDVRAGWLAMERSDPGGSRALLVCNFSPEEQAIPVPLPGSQWHLRLWSGGARYGQVIAGHGTAIYTGH